MRSLLIAYQYNGSGQETQALTTITSFYNGAASNTSIDTFLFTYSGYAGEPNILQVFIYNSNSQVGEIDTYDEAGGSRTLAAKETFTYTGNDLEGDELYMPGASTPYRIDLYGYSNVNGGPTTRCRRPGTRLPERHPQRHLRARPRH